ncbi:MAG: luxQ 1 [Betaproteobacteria bacterium]|nr:luxQ 1 [Betaproteobacteria bacterium]
MNKPFRILNLDDNAAARYIRTRELKREGFEVLEARTGEEALRIAREQRPDIALLDVQLPDISGLEVCRRIKADPLTSEIPVVHISATHVTEGDQAAGLEHGADIYLTEPTESIVLITVIRTLLRLRQSESRLLASEQKFRAIVNQATAGIVQLDLTGRIVHANGRYSELLGRPATEIEQMSLFELTHPDDAPRCRVQFDRMVAEGVPFNIEKRLIRPDGGIVWTSNSISVVRNNYGAAERAIAIVIDINERKQGEEREHFMARVADGLAELSDQTGTLQKVAAVVVPAIADWCALDIVDGEGRQKRVASSHVDPQKQGMLDPAAGPAVDAYPHAELISNVWDARPDQRPGDAERLDALRQSGLRSYIYVPLMSRNKVLGTLTLGTSSSGRCYQPADLAMACELGRRVSIGLENANLYQAISASAKRKDEFLATLAHELRNPLAPLRNSLHIIKSAGQNPEVTAYAHEVMERQVSQMQRLVDDLLDVSRIDTGKIELRRERIALSTVVKSALDAIRHSLESQHELTVTLPARDVYLDVDPARLAQIITNLLDNANKFTPPGGHVSLSAAVEGGELAIVVTDTGIGIRPEMLDNIFDMFVQGDSSFERPYGGLGIGLTLVKRLIGMHGGTVRAESGGAQQGSRFIVRLPVAVTSEAPTALPAAGAEEDQVAKCVILVVDDNRDSAQTLGSLLGLMGHQAHVAYDGPQGLEAAKKFRPDIIFLDIGLPGLSGYDVAKRMRKDETSKNARIIALSGYGTTADHRRSLLAGFNAHIVKPIDMEEINDVIRQAQSGGPAKRQA